MASDRPPPTVRQPEPSAAVTWADAIKASAERDAAERTREKDTGRADASGDRWGRIRQEARTLGGAGAMGYLLWVEKRCVDGGLHALDPHWLYHFEDFYASGKMLDVGRAGLRAAKSDSNLRAITAECLLVERRLEPSIVGVCPILSSKISEANDRVLNARMILQRCGFVDLTGQRGATDVEPFQFRVTGGGNTPQVIELLDSQAHPIEYRISPANEGGAAGFTGIAGFADELDLWGKKGSANSAAKVFELLITRYTTQPEAKLHAWSATYDRDSYHAEMIARGDTSLQRVARLGINGALKDDAERRRLARTHGCADPLLLAPSDPMSTDIPAWVSNPVAPIERCYEASNGDLRRMFALFGGRPEFAGGGADAEGQCFMAAAINGRLAERFGSRRRPPPGGVMKVPGARPGDIRYAGPPPRTPTSSWRTRKVM